VFLIENVLPGLISNWGLALTIEKIIKQGQISKTQTKVKQHGTHSRLKVSAKQRRQRPEQTKNYETGFRFWKTNENAKQRLLCFRNVLKIAAEIFVGSKWSITAFS